MSRDKPLGASLIVALRDVGRQLWAEVHAAARNVIISVATGMAMVVLLITAAAASAAIAMWFLALGLQGVLHALLRSTWAADIATGIIMAAWPLIGIVVARRYAQPQAAPTPPPSPAPAPDPAPASAHSAP